MIFGVEEWLAWFLLAMGLFLVEALIAFTFYAGPVALGALLASAVAALDASSELQVVAFIAGSLLSLAFLRPIVREHMHPPDPEHRSNVSSLIGRRAVALQRVDIDSGTVRIGDEVWSARTESESVVVQEGARAEVVSVSGVYAYVKPTSEEEQRA